MNKKLLLSVGTSFVTITSILATVSCTNNSNKQFSLFNLRSDARIILDVELAKRDGFLDDKIHDNNLFAQIEIQYNNAIRDISKAQTPIDIEGKKIIGIKNIQNAILAYKSSNTIFKPELMKISSLVVTGDIAEMTSDSFFGNIKTSLDNIIKKNNILIGVIATIDKSTTEVNEFNKLVVFFKTNKTGNTIFSSTVEGYTHTGLNLIPYKILIRLFADYLGYNHLSNGLTSYKYTLISSGHSMIVEYKNNK